LDLPLSDGLGGARFIAGIMRLYEKRSAPPYKNCASPRRAAPQLCCATDYAREEPPQPPDCFTDTHRTNATRSQRTAGHTAKQAVNAPMATELPQEPGGWRPQRGFAWLDCGRLGNARTQRQVPRTPKDVSAAILARGEFALAPAAMCERLQDIGRGETRCKLAAVLELRRWRIALLECAA
jgi:hypothetical protein